MLELKIASLQIPKKSTFCLFRIVTSCQIHSRKNDGPRALGVWEITKFYRHKIMITEIPHCIKKKNEAKNFLDKLFECAMHQHFAIKFVILEVEVVIKKAAAKR